jgi:ABC-type glycerol-3-phosphate transport system substrate-binding protein
MKIRKTTKYEQLAKIIRDIVKSLPNGEKLMSVRDMMREYHVSYATVDKALKALLDEGCIEKIWGKGIYAKHKTVERPRKVLRLLSMGLKEKALQKLCDTYESSNSSIKIEIVRFTHKFISGEPYPPDKYIEIINSCDIVFVANTFVPYLAENNNLIEIPREWISKNLTVTEASEKALKLSSYKDKIVALPISVDPSVIVFNQELFAKNDIKQSLRPLSWEEFTDTARRLTYSEADGKKVFGFSFNAELKDLLPHIWSNNGGHQPGSYQLKEKETTEAIEFLYNLVFKHEVCLGQNLASDISTPELFSQGYIAMLQGKFRTLRYLKKLNPEQPLGIMPLPANELEATIATMSGLGVSSESSMKDDAFKFIKFIAETSHSFEELWLGLPIWKDYYHKEDMIFIDILTSARPVWDMPDLRPLNLLRKELIKPLMNLEQITETIKRTNIELSKYD